MIRLIPLIRLLLPAAAFCPAAKAATISVAGWLEVAGGRQTIDWLIFEVTSPSVVSVQAWVDVGNSNTSWMVLGQLSGTDKLEYHLEINGEVRAIEWREGQLAPEPYGSFKVTSIPETSFVSLLTAGVVLAGTLRRRNGN